MKRLAFVVGMIFTPLALGTGISHAQTPLNPESIEAACASAAKAEPATFRPGHTKMWCAVVNREGKLLAINATDTGGTPQTPLGSDAWRGSIEIAIAKAYTAVAFSSNDTALDSRTVGLVTRQDGPDRTTPRISARTLAWRLCGALAPAIHTVRCSDSPRAAMTFLAATIMESSRLPEASPFTPRAAGAMWRRRFDWCRGCQR